MTISATGTRVLCILVPATSAPEPVWIPAEPTSAALAHLQAIVGGDIEAVPTYSSGTVFYLNEGGKLLGLPVNQNRDFLRSLGPQVAQDDVLVGAVVVAGTNAQGDLCDAVSTVAPDVAGALMGIPRARMAELIRQKRIGSTVTQNGEVVVPVDAIRAAQDEYCEAFLRSGSLD